MARIRAVPRLCWRKGAADEVVAVDLTPAFPLHHPRDYYANWFGIGSTPEPAKHRGTV